MKSRKLYKIINTKTHEELDENKISETNHIASLPLEIEYDYALLKRRYSTHAFLNKDIPVFIKYQELFPLTIYDRIISLGEGNTPLIKSHILNKVLGLNKLYFKHEGFNPTGAFKDRGSLVEVTKALEYKAKAIVVASTGNMAASVSAYAAYIQIPCFVFVPRNTPDTKLAQSLFYGSKIIEVDGGYDNALSLAEKTSQEFNFYLAGDFAFRTEGQKSQAYEVVVQLGIHSPDYVLVPVGNGTNIYAIWKGFKEFYQMGILDKLPKMVAIEVDSYNSVYYSYKHKIKNIKPIEISTPTVATAIAVKNPSDGVKVLELIKESKGASIVVSDEEIKKAQFELSSCESVFVEPSSATVYAGLKKLNKNNRIDKNSIIVCILTGTGLKDPMSGLNSLSEGKSYAKGFSDVVSIFKRKKWIK